MVAAKLNLNFFRKFSDMTAKAVNYTPEQTTAMVADYAAGVTVEKIAETWGKSVKSVVAKLVYVAKDGTAVVKKNELADKMAELFGLTEAEADSLTKANKTALKKILDKFTEL